jgi:SagB-type dehydrogenase family enzyme
MSWKYEGIAYSLILKEVGGLFQTIYLVAAALGLGACAIGLGPLDTLESLAGLDPREEPQIGEIVVGVPRQTAPGC